MQRVFWITFPLYRWRHWHSERMVPKEWDVVLYSTSVREAYIRSSRGGEDSGRGLPVCNAVQCRDRIPTFRRMLLHPEVGGIKVLGNVGVLQQHYTALQPGRLRFIGLIFINIMYSNIFIWLTEGVIIGLFRYLENEDASCSCRHVAVLRLSCYTATNNCAYVMLCYVMFLLLFTDTVKNKCIQANGSQGYSGRGFKSTTHLNMAPRLRMRGAVTPVLHTSSWRGA